VSLKSRRFPRFSAAYEPDPWATGPSDAWSADDTADLLGTTPRLFTEFLEEVACSSYSGGLLRFLLPGGTPSLKDWNGPSGWSREWPEWRSRFVVFGYDWLGRLLAFDDRRRHVGEPMIGILEPGTGQLLEVPEPFAALIESELIDFSEAALAADFYRAWIDSGGRAPLPHECIGYRKPLFLGGEDAVTNLEVCDLEVYVSLCGQLNQQAQSIPEGTRIGQVKKFKS
jgi:hypothetical protein